MRSGIADSPRETFSGKYSYVEAGTEDEAMALLQAGLGLIRAWAANPE